MSEFYDSRIGNLSIISKTCIQCKNAFAIKVNKEDLVDYNNGKLIQDAFPYITASERELIISGICGKCFDKMFEDDVYVENGFKDRNDYLNSLAEDYDIPIDNVMALASLLGPSEDFDGLIMSLEDLSMI